MRLQTYPSRLGGMILAAAALLIGLGVPAPGLADDKPTVTPYGWIELDAVYSSRNTNPLDPNQFNGYATAAGTDKFDSATFNPRFTLLGIKAEHEGLKAVGEFDFYGSDSIGLIAPRFRLGYIDYTSGSGRLTLGQDWLPVMSSHPAALDFSIMGYGGNLWIRIPQVTYRRKMGNMEVLGTLFRNERSGFKDSVKLPYAGVRAAYTGWGLFALSAAFRSYKDRASDEDVASYLVGTEVSAPLGPVTLSGELATGQGLGAEFFRFGQELNPTKPGEIGPTPIPTLVGWANLAYSPAEEWSLAAGYGFDNPKNEDLDGAKGSLYTVNQRVFGNVVRHIYKGFKVGGEVTQLMTKWVGDTKNYSGQQVMLTGWYVF